LRETPFYNENALIYPREKYKVQTIDTLKIGLTFPLKKTISAGEIFFINLYTTKENSIIYIRYKIENYDIRFSVVKMNKLADLKNQTDLKKPYITEIVEEKVCYKEDKP